MSLTLSLTAFLCAVAYLVYQAVRYDREMKRRAMKAEVKSEFTLHKKDGLVYVVPAVPAVPAVPVVPVVPAVKTLKGVKK